MWHWSYDSFVQTLNVLAFIKTRSSLDHSQFVLKNSCSVHEVWVLLSLKQEDKQKRHSDNFYSNYYANSTFCLMKKLNRSIFPSSPFNQIDQSSFKLICRLSENGMNPKLCTSGSWMKHPYLWRAFSISNSLCCDYSLSMNMEMSLKNQRLCVNLA